MTICKEEDCKTQATYNYKGSNPKYCSTHKKENMFDVRSKKCIDCNQTQPNYNKPGLKPLYCVNCKDDDMVNVLHKLCKTLTISSSLQLTQYNGFNPGLL